MNVVVTGAAGFVASHVVDRFLSLGHTVVAVDNFVTGSKRNLTSAERHARFTFVTHDCSLDWSPVYAVCRSLGAVHLVLHLASPASPVDYVRYPIETLLVNSIGTKNALDFTLAFKARFLYASTSETYGDPLVHPQPETYWGNVNPVGVRSCYDEAKRFGEAMTMAYVRSRGADARIVRIFNTYGPRMRVDDGRVVPNFIMQALRGEPLTVYGDGSQTRSFCFVDDLVDGIVRCSSSEKTRGTIMNLGNPNECTIAQFARAIADVTGVDARIENRALPPDDPTRRCPDISKALELLGWEPKVDLQTGLRATVRYFREQQLLGDTAATGPSRTSSRLPNRLP